LADLRRGQCATITATLSGCAPATAERLRDLGFRPNSQVEVVRRAPLGDPTVFRVRNAEMCLRRGEAAQLVIAVADGDSR
jgi:ferrous iron transport protein A